MDTATFMLVQKTRTKKQECTQSPHQLQLDVQLDPQENVLLRGSLVFLDGKFRNAEWDRRWRVANPVASCSLSIFLLLPWFPWCHATWCDWTHTWGNNVSCCSMGVGNQLGLLLWSVLLVPVVSLLEQLAAVSLPVIL